MPSITEDLAMARDVLSDIRSSIKIRKHRCSACNAESWDNFEKYKMKLNIDGALSRIEKAMEIARDI
jgi:isopropylmalate/homocitrate/citramalate synthase